MGESDGLRSVFGVTPGEVLERIFLARFLEPAKWLPFLRTNRGASFQNAELTKNEAGQNGRSILRADRKLRRGRCEDTS